jgi:LPXTG-site transpeptidase (sortase) family protein
MRKLLLLALLIAALTTPSTAAARTNAGTPILFPETGHTLAYNFRDFYDRQGGLSIFGLPLTEVFIEDGRPVQYFERARFEWHADLLLVQGGLLGNWAARDMRSLPAFQPVAGPQGTDDFFRETGHTLGGEFRNFWRRNGGLATFGYPISEPFLMPSAEDGVVRTVQYFERARFEYHPQNPAAYRVLLGHLGRQLMEVSTVPEWAKQPVSSADAAWAALKPNRIQMPRLNIDTQIVTTGYSAGVWDVPRYTAAHYWPISAVPGTEGNIVLAGHVGYRNIIFNYMPGVQIGDEMIVTTGSGDHRYRVISADTLLPSETWVLNPTETETVTIITCVPIGTYTHRLIVRAVPID